MLLERRSTLYLAQGIIDDLEHDLVQICGAKDEDDGHPHQDEDDGPFFESIRRAMDNCDVAQSELDFMTPRPLQNKRSPKTRNPLGVVMSEAGDDVELEEGGIMKWKEATMNSNPGDAFVMDIVPGGQAKEIGLFEIGDQLQAVGNLPVAHGGFEKVVGMLQDALKSANYIKLQFDRISVRQPFERAGLDEVTSPVRIVDEGAWSSLGRRRAKEDFFVLHDIHLDKDALLAGVFDGHGGKAAAQSASQLMPSLCPEQLAHGAITSRQALELAWQSTCDTYRNGCDEMGECVAEYDAQDGVLMASTGSEDLVAGTTASVATLKENELTVLNCEIVEIRGHYLSIQRGKSSSRLSTTLERLNKSVCNEARNRDWTIAFRNAHFLSGGSNAVTCNTLSLGLSRDPSPRPREL